MNGPGPWCPVCRQPVPATGLGWKFSPHGGCRGEGTSVRDRDHGFVTGDGRVVPEWEFNAPVPCGQCDDRRHDWQQAFLAGMAVAFLLVMLMTLTDAW